ncbi:hypothetical protein OSTOST_20564, partial [Ostertagia ostertagi]
DHSLSLLSEEVNVSFGSEASENNNLSRSFCGFNSSHRPLDTVHEECESQESTTLSSETAGPPTVKTRIGFSNVDKLYCLKPPTKLLELTRENLKKKGWSRICRVRRLKANECSEGVGTAFCPDIFLQTLPSRRLFLARPIYLALIKEVLLLLYVLRAIHANLELDVLCYDTTPTTSEIFPKVKI